MRKRNKERKNKKGYLLVVLEVARLLASSTCLSSYLYSINYNSTVNKSRDLTLL